MDYSGTRNHSPDSTSADVPGYTPAWKKVWFDKLPPFEFVDPALRADKEKPHLLTPSTVMREISPRMGTVLRNLALLISERKVVAFPDQDFIDAGPKACRHSWITSASETTTLFPRAFQNFRDFMLSIETGAIALDTSFEQRTTSCLWHQDVSYEVQPPGYVML
ncbi:hypothetical protein B0H13DRAFT_1906306, partial [Mycena leptocephala]